MVGDIIRTLDGKTYIVCDNTCYYFLVNLENGQCSDEYVSLKKLTEDYTVAGAVKLNRW